MESLNKKVFIIVIGLVVLIVAGIGVWWYMGTTTEVQNEPVQTPQTKTEDRLIEYTSVKGKVILVENISPGQKVASPLDIYGQAPGPWYFEGSFPVEIQDANGNVLDAKPATAIDEWMTTDHARFTLELVFAPSTSTGKLVFRNDNPSDNRALDDYFEIPITF